MERFSLFTICKVLLDKLCSLDIFNSNSKPQFIANSRNLAIEVSQ